MNATDFYLALMVGNLNRGQTYSPDIPIDKLEVNASSQPLYSAIAPKGSATSSAVWFIRKYAYDGSGNYTGSTYAYNVAWDDRATSTYA